MVCNMSCRVERASRLRSHARGRFFFHMFGQKHSDDLPIIFHNVCFCTYPPLTNPLLAPLVLNHSSHAYLRRSRSVLQALLLAMRGAPSTGNAVPRHGGRVLPWMLVHHVLLGPYRQQVWLNRHCPCGGCQPLGTSVLE